MSKADNMLAILWLLKTKKRVTAKQIAEELEIHIRTVYRYIDALCASGVPIMSDSGHNGGYSLPEQFTESPLFFDQNEQKALTQAALFAQEAGYPYGEELERAIAKLKRYTNPAQKEELERHLIGFDVIQPPGDGTLHPVLQELEKAVADSSILQIEYDNVHAHYPKQVDKRRSINPYGLVYWKGKWYVVAYCHRRQEIRSFRADRIRGLMAAGESFERPSGFSARQFFMQGLLPGIQGEEQLISVHLEGTVEALEDLSKHWLFGHLTVERSSRHFIFKAEEQAVIHYVPYILLSYGKSIRVLQPTLLKEKLVAIALELANFYQSH